MKQIKVAGVKIVVSSVRLINYKRVSFCFIGAKLFLRWFKFTHLAVDRVVWFLVSRRAE